MSEDKIEFRKAAQDVGEGVGLRKWRAIARQPRVRQHRNSKVDARLIDGKHRRVVRREALHSWVDLHPAGSLVLNHLTEVRGSSPSTQDGGVDRDED